MSKTSKRATIRLTRFEVQAAFEACSNYTPPSSEGWKQAAQTRVVTELSRALRKLEQDAKKQP